MTTENGIENLRYVRNNIERLAERRDYLLARWGLAWEAFEANRAEPMVRGGAEARAEFRALEWALPILEVEWDTHARLRREIINPAENRRDQRPERPPVIERGAVRAQVQAEIAARRTPT